MSSLDTQIYKERIILKGSETDTLAIKDKIKLIEGRHYNANLRDAQKNRFKAWTFPLNKKYELDKIINDYEESLKPKVEIKPIKEVIKKKKPSQEEYSRLQYAYEFVITKAERKKYKKLGYDFRKKEDHLAIRRFLLRKREPIKL